MSLMRSIREYPVPRGAVALWWFGQSGYIFKSPEGALAGVDLYLTDSCRARHPEVNFARRVPVLIDPGELELDAFLCTHNHQDHTDPETIRALRHKDAMSFIGPMPSCETFRREGVESGRIVPAWPGCEIETGDLRLTGTFALPTDASDLNHMGFVLRFGNGPKIYLTGDTADHELLHSAAAHSPDLMITVINGGFNNLSHWEAARLAAVVKPKAAIPCHYDMFADNAADPRQFRAALALTGASAVYTELKHGEPFLFSRP